MRAKRKKDSQMIGELKKKGENTDAVQEEVRKIGDDIKALEEKQSELDTKQRDILLHIPGADNDPEGHADQVGIGEHTSGADFAVVIDDLHALVLQFLVQLVGIGLDLGIVGADSTDVHLPGCNGQRPNGAVCIVMRLADGGGEAADADTVAAHNGILGFALAVDIGHMHGFGVFGAQLEDIAHFNAAGYGDGGFAAMRADAALLDLGKIVVLGILHITGHGKAGVVIFRHIGAAAEIVHPF